MKMLDDASNTTASATNALELVTENKVDASARIIEQNDARKNWVFKTPQNDIRMSLAVAGYMADSGLETMALIAFSDGCGAQMLELLAAKPDAVLVIAEGANGKGSVFNISAKEHLGLEQRAHVMGRIDNETWKHLP